jgi:thymidine phosphorylase
MIKEAIGKLVAKQSLSEVEAQQVMTEIFEGVATPAQLAAFLVALRLKGETQEELLGLVRTMRAKATPVHAGNDLLDTCGTGGDGTGTRLPQASSRRRRGRVSPSTAIAPPPASAAAPMSSRPLGLSWR